MTAVILAIATGMFGYLTQAILVGAALGAIRLRSGGPPLNRRVFLGLFGVFALLDLYWIPCIWSLDVYVRIRNPSAAAVFGEYPLAGVSGFTLFDAVLWAIQGVVAVWVAERLSRTRVGAI